LEVKNKNIVTSLNRGFSLTSLDGDI